MAMARSYLPANLAHNARYRHDVIVQAMSPRLVPNAIADDLLKVCNSSTFAQRLEQIHFFVT